MFGSTCFVSLFFFISILPSSSRAWLRKQSQHFSIRQSICCQTFANANVTCSAGVHYAPAGWLRLTIGVLTNPQPCGFQIQPQDFSSSVTLQTRTSLSSRCVNNSVDKPSSGQTHDASPTLTSGEARLVRREALEDAVGGHGERLLLRRLLLGWIQHL